MAAIKANAIAAVYLFLCCFTRNTVWFDPKLLLKIFFFFKWNKPKTTFSKSLSSLVCDKSLDPAESWHSPCPLPAIGLERWVIKQQLSPPQSAAELVEPHPGGQSLIRRAAAKLQDLSTYDPHQHSFLSPLSGLTSPPWRPRATFLFLTMTKDCRGPLASNKGSKHNQREGASAFLRLSVCVPVSSVVKHAHTLKYTVNDSETKCADT